MNSTSRLPDFYNDSAEVTSYGSLQAGLLIPVSVFIVGGNSLTILAVCITPHLRSVPNMYIVSLAVADILAGLSTMYASLPLIPHLTEVFDANKYLCLSRYALVYTLLSASIANLAAVAVDRYIYILYPLRYTSAVTSYKAGIVIAIVWLFSAVWGTVPLYINTWESGKRCLMFHVLSTTYQACLASVMYGLGSLAIIWCWGSILRAAKQQMRQIEGTTVFAERDGNHHTTSKHHKDWKLIKMFIIIFGVFFVCWLPCVVGVTAKMWTQVSETYMGFALTIGMLNSGMNVFIYAVKNLEFRNAFADILCKPCVRFKSRNN